MKIYFHLLWFNSEIKACMNTERAKLDGRQKSVDIFLVLFPVNDIGKQHGAMATSG